MINLVFLYLFLQSLTDTNPGWTLEREIIRFNQSFLENPFVITTNDRIVFSFNKDTIIRASETWSSDTKFVWVDYPEHGLNDFWEVYLRNKNDWGAKANGELREFPKKYIFEYFKDKGVELRDIIIYNAYSIVPHKANFTKTTSSYTGVRFVFKIRKQHLPKLAEVQDSLTELKNNYR